MKEVKTYQAHKQEGILLNANERSDNPDPVILDEFMNALKEMNFNRYPDDSCKDLIQAYANYIDLEPEQILAGNGSDGMLGLLIGTFLGYGKSLATLDPDFSMYDYYASSYQAGVKKMKIEPGEKYDVLKLGAFAKENGCDLILFSNPNNPTGIEVSKDEIEKLLQAYPEIPVVVDEAYMEFGNESAIALLDKYPNLYVTRTLSKAFGIASARLGFLISNKENMAKIRPEHIVYSVNSISQLLGQACLKHADLFKESVQKTKARRDAFYDSFKESKRFKIHPSSANFLLLTGENLSDLKAAFDEKGIRLRTWPDKEWIRITIGSDEEMEQVEKILNRFEEGI